MCIYDGLLKFPFKHVFGHLKKTFQTHFCYDFFLQKKNCLKFDLIPSPTIKSFRIHEPGKASSLKINLVYAEYVKFNTSDWFWDVSSRFVGPEKWKSYYSLTVERAL